MRRNSPAWGEGRSQEGSRPPRREFVERPVVERAPTAAESDNQWRAKMKPDAPELPTQPAHAAKSPALSSRELSTPSSPAAAPAVPTAPATRPKLNLAKRTVSEVVSETAPSPAADPKASPFGAAKPIDTATREKEIEEKRQLALREKKEAEEKLRAEKKIADDKAREEKKAAKEAEDAAKPQQVSSPKDKANGQRQEKQEKREKQEKENGGSGPPPGKNYEILRRNANEENSAADEEAEEAEAADQNGLVTEDKETKPKEIVRTNGAAPAASPETTAETLEGDGWSTVSKPQKNRKNGNQGGRAIAS